MNQSSAIEDVTGACDKDHSGIFSRFQTRYIITEVIWLRNEVRETHRFDNSETYPVISMRLPSLSAITAS